VASERLKITQLYLLKNITFYFSMKTWKVIFMWKLFLIESHTSFWQNPMLKTIFLSIKKETFSFKKNEA
jgi:hypothetical protein